MVPGAVGRAAGRTLVCSRRAGGPVRRRRGRPDALRARTRRPGGRDHGDRQRRRRHGPARPAHQPRPRYRHLHPGGHGQSRHRMGRGRRELGGHGRARPDRRRGLVPSRRSRPGHTPVPDRPAARRRDTELGDGGTVRPARCRGADVARDRRSAAHPGHAGRAEPAGAGRHRSRLPGLLRAPSPRRGGQRRAVRGRRLRPARARGHGVPGGARTRSWCARRIPSSPSGRCWPSRACARRWPRAGRAWWRCHPSSPAPPSRGRRTG